jgi:hypothetical protein
VFGYKVSFWSSSDTWFRYFYEERPPVMLKWR